MANEKLKEELAKLAHEQWSGWMDYLFSKCRETRPSDGEAFHEDCLIIPEWAVDRWKRQAKTPYSDLTPAEMDSDRTEADKFLAVINHRQPDKELVDALRCLMYSLDHIIDCIGNEEMSLEVASGIINAAEVLAKYKGKK